MDLREVAPCRTLEPTVALLGERRDRVTLERERLVELPEQSEHAPEVVLRARDGVRKAQTIGFDESFAERLLGVLELPELEEPVADVSTLNARMTQIAGGEECSRRELHRFNAPDHVALEHRPGGARIVDPARERCEGTLGHDAVDLREHLVRLFVAPGEHQLRRDVGHRDNVRARDLPGARPMRVGSIPYSDGKTIVASSTAATITAIIVERNSCLLLGNSFRFGKSVLYIFFFSCKIN